MISYRLPEIIGLSFITIGLLVFLVGLLGGGINIKEIPIPKLGKLMRYSCLTTGLFLALFGLFGTIQFPTAIPQQHTDNQYLKKESLNSTNGNGLIIQADTIAENAIKKLPKVDSLTTPLVVQYNTGSATVKDADGNVYKTVKIGKQMWMAENLRVTKYNDGKPINLVADNASWKNIQDSHLTTQAYCFYNNTTNADSIRKFGSLYNWYVIETNKLAPKGWHVPSDAEWDTLQNYLITNGYNWDGTTTGNKIAKSLAVNMPSWDAICISIRKGAMGFSWDKNNSSGFSAQPGGFRANYGMFYQKGYEGRWWSATEHSATTACIRSLYSGHVDLIRDCNEQECSGFSVRLVRDN